MRKLIAEILNEDEQIEVVGFARNGTDGLLKIKTLKPDVISLDIEMPVMDGITTLKEIMRDIPTPVVMLSGTNRSGVELVMECMKLGAVNFIEKPSGVFSQDLHRIKREMVQKIKEAATVNINVLNRAGSLKKSVSSSVYSKEQTTGKDSLVNYSGNSWPKMICIGASTGGPRALYTVLPLLNGNIEAPILIVQHMPQGFTKSFAGRLNELSNITVKEAVDGELIRNGTAYLAPGGSHLRVLYQSGVMVARVEKTPPMNGHRPSVDVLFNSVSELPQIYECVAVLMTGMGSDGTKGIMNIGKRKKSILIAESEETCVVFGMPKSAIATGRVDQIIPLYNIAEALNEIVRVRGDKG